MKNIISIVKKEFARFFKDRRMVFTTLLLPGLMIYVLYTFMGSALQNMLSVDDDYVPSVYVVNMPQSISAVFSAVGLDTISATENELDAIRQDITDMNADLCIVFPTGFDADVAEYDAQTSIGAAPNIEIYYNSASTNSISIYMKVTALLDSYESALANKFDINNGEGIYDLVTEKDSTGFMFASLLPLLLTMFMFSGCMAVAPESIAGEKERGTIATILVTPIKRSELALGKILSLAVIAFLSGISSTIGTFLSLPKLMSMDDMGMSADIYGINEYLFLGLIILSMILVIISLISIISAFAKTVKEATSIIMPLMIVVMLVGLSSMFSSGAPTNNMLYLIPLYNGVQCMSSILSFNFVPTHIFITIASNVAFAGIASFVLTRMFNSEKIIFTK